MNINIYKDGQQFGPFSPSEAWEHVLQGHFNPETDYAWHEGLSDWLPLKDVILQVAPPAHQAKDLQSTIPQEEAAIPSKVKVVSVKPKMVIGMLMVVVVLIVIGVFLSSRSSAQTAASVVPATTTNPITTDAALFKGKWHFVIQGDDGSPALCANIISDGENIEVDAWVPNKGKTITVEGKLSASQQQIDGVLCDIATFQEQGEKASFLLHSPNGTYAFSYRASGFHVLSPGLMQSPSTQENSTQVSEKDASQPPATQDAVKTPSVGDYYGEYRGHTDAYHVKDTGGNDLLCNGNPIIVHAYDTTVKFTSTGIEVSQINTNTDIISMLSQGNVQVNAIDGNSVTITVTVAQSLNAKLSASKPSYKFVFNKDGTGKMIPLTERTAPTIDLTNTSLSDKPKAAPTDNTITDAPSGDRYYYEGDMGDKRMILMLTKTSKDFYLTFFRAYESERPYMLYHLTYDGTKEDANQVDYGTVESDFVFGASSVPSAHNEQIVYNKGSDTFTIAFTTGASTFTKQEPTDLQSCITTAKDFLAKVLKKKEHDDLVQDGAYFVTKQIESKVGPVNQIALYSDKADEITNAEITYTVQMGDNTSHYVTVRGSKDNWKITDIDYKTP